MKALLSVYDKTGIEELARGLSELGWDLISSGGTSAALTAAGIDHIEVAELTGAPEMLGGRVKTLHPVIHGGILADRSKPDHLEALDKLGIGLIDLVVCNLYPFSSDPSIELIDVGGPTMVRAAAKNHDHVAVVVDPADYAAVLDELRAAGSISLETRRRLARQAFAHTAGYDAAIVEWLDEREHAAQSEQSDADVSALDEAALLPDSIHLTLERAGGLRYGENPHQHGARYRVAGQHSWWDDVVQYGGKELSYLNVFDADAAWRLVHELPSSPTELAVAIIKHANPCGAALDADLVAAYQQALDCDPQSAFGGIVAIGGRVTMDVAEAIAADLGQPDSGGPSGRCDHRPRLRRRGPGAAVVQAEGHPALVGTVARAAGAPVPVLGGQRPGPGHRPLPGRPFHLGGGHCPPAHRGRVAGPADRLEGVCPHDFERHRHRDGGTGRRRRGRPAVPGGGRRDRRGQGRGPGPWRCRRIRCLLPLPGRADGAG